MFKGYRNTDWCLAVIKQKRTISSKPIVLSSCPTWIRRYSFIFLQILRHSINARTIKGRHAGMSVDKIHQGGVNIVRNTGVKFVRIYT